MFMEGHTHSFCEVDQKPLGHYRVTVINHILNQFALPPSDLRNEDRHACVDLSEVPRDIRDELITAMRGIDLGVAINATTTSSRLGAVDV